MSTEKQNNQLTQAANASTELSDLAIPDENAEQAKGGVLREPFDSNGHGTHVAGTLGSG